MVRTKDRLLKHLNLRGNGPNYKRVDRWAEQPSHTLDASGARMNRLSLRSRSTFDSFGAYRTVCDESIECLRPNPRYAQDVTSAAAA